MSFSPKIVLKVDSVVFTYKVMYFKVAQKAETIWDTFVSKFVTLARILTKLAVYEEIMMSVKNHHIPATILKIASDI